MVCPMPVHIVVHVPYCHITQLDVKCQGDLVWLMQAEIVLYLVTGKVYKYQTLQADG